MDHLCYLCLKFVILSRLFIAALWSPAGKGLTSWLLFVMFYDFVTFRFGILDQVWYLIVLIPDPCCLLTLNKFCLIIYLQTFKKHTWHGLLCTLPYISHITSHNFIQYWPLFVMLVLGR